MLKTQSRTIGGLEVTVTQFPALTAFAIWHKLAGLIGSVLGQVPAGGGLAGLGMAIFAKHPPEVTQALLLELLCCSTAVRDGKQIPLNTHEMLNVAFAGNPGAMISAAKFSIEVNFADFFDEALAGLKQAAASATQGKPSSSKKNSGRRGRRGG